MRRYTTTSRMNVRIVLKLLGKVYKNYANAQKQVPSATKRLDLHQRTSGPLNGNVKKKSVAHPCRKDTEEWGISVKAMDSNNVPIGAIQWILGHENRKSTEIYLHSIGDLEREAIAVFEYARKNSHTDDAP